jgi:hypothetical protein
LSGSCKQICGDNTRCYFNRTTRDVRCSWNWLLPLSMATWWRLL